MASDDELLQAWQGGDRHAGDELVSRYFEPICRFFRGKLGDDVEDLVQRTFLDCVQAHDRVHQASFRSYLFAIARHRLFDHLRTGLRRPVDELGSRSIAELRTRPSDRMARAQDHELVARALLTLPLDFQIALELAYWEELAGAEIASVLGIPENTVRSRLSRGRSMLRDALARAVEDPVRLATSLASLPAAARDKSP